MNIKEIVYNKNNIGFSKENVIYLVFDNPLLVSASLEENGDEYSIKYNFDEYISLEEMGNESETDKLRLLINCAELEMLRNEYSFSISPDNLVCDINLMPKVIEREISDDYNDFCNEYKALVGSLLFSKYSFEDYYSGGKDLYKKKKFLKNISRQEDTTTIKEILVEEYDALVKDIKKNKALVSKKSRLAARIAVPVMAVFTAAITAVGGWLFFVHTPYQKSLTAAENAYIAEDYIKVQNELSGISLNKIPVNEKYILSRAYIITEALNAEQKENILSGITLKTDERVLSYWIELGRLNFDSASDFSKQLGDDELLLFSLIKKNAHVKSDTNISGEEKAATISELESQIKELTEKLQTQSDEASQTDSVS